MKKTLIITLALVFVLGLAGTAFANPYSDVPAGHWAYKAVNDLQKAGVMEGAGGKFMGNQTLTRYEIAAITARAMAKADKADAAAKATIDKLAVEFSKELNDLGVRVAKLEKNQGGMKWNGDYRMRWFDADAADGGTSTQHRLRLYANAKVNEDTNAFVRIVSINHKDLGTTGSNFEVVDANATIKNFAGFGDLKVGRYSYKLGTIGYYADSTGMYDGAQLAFNAGDVKLTVSHADVAAVKPYVEIDSVQADYAVDKDLTLSAYYLKPGSSDEKVLGFGAKYAFDKDWTLSADFMTVEKGSLMAGKVGKDADNMHVRLNYKAANKNVVGSYGAFLEYVDYESAALDSGAYINTIDGKKFVGVGLFYTLAPNVVFDAFYYDYDTVKGVKPVGSNTSYTRAEVNFLF